MDAFLHLLLPAKVASMILVAIDARYNAPSMQPFPTQTATHPQMATEHLVLVPTFSQRQSFLLELLYLCISQRAIGIAVFAHVVKWLAGPSMRESVRVDTTQRGRPLRSVSFGLY